MKKLITVLIAILALAVSISCISDNIEKSKDSEKSDNISIKLKPKQGEKFKNSIGMEFVYIAPGKFKMGFSPSAEEPVDIYIDLLHGSVCILESLQRNNVTLTKGFWMQTTELTKGQFKKFVDKTHYQTDKEKIPLNPIHEKFEDLPLLNWRDPGFDQTDEHPVVYVTWNDAKSFCEWLTKEDKEGNVYSLPTEAEWEYACRAGSNTAYYWGGKIDGDYCWYSKNAGNSTHSVGKKKPNSWGLYDMSGNVWEWCSNWCDLYPEGELTNPKGPNTGKYRVVRGGAWNFKYRSCRSGESIGFGPNTATEDIGFRVVCESKEHK